MMFVHEVEIGLVCCIFQYCISYTPTNSLTNGPYMVRVADVIQSAYKWRNSISVWWINLNIYNIHDWLRDLMVESLGSDRLNE